MSFEDNLLQFEYSKLYKVFSGVEVRSSLAICLPPGYIGDVMVIKRVAEYKQHSDPRGLKNYAYYIKLQLIMLGSLFIPGKI